MHAITPINSPSTGRKYCPTAIKPLLNNGPIIIPPPKITE